MSDRSPHERVSPMPSPGSGTTSFTDLCYWARDDQQLLGEGGWTITITGPDRLRRMSATWMRVVRRASELGLAPARALGFLSSTFDERGAASSILRIPARVTRVLGQQTSTIRQEFPRETVAEACDAGSGLSETFIPEPLPEQLPASRYADCVAEVLEHIAHGSLEKVVTVCDEDVPLTERAAFTALEFLTQSYPNAWSFAVGGLFGATPELLASLDSGTVRARVLAATLPHEQAPDAATQTLLRNDRFRHEHAVAAKSVLTRWAQYVNFTVAQPEPYVLELPNVFHLATDITGTLRNRALTVLDLTAEIHPTGAVAGWPRESSMALIRAVERRDRGRFAGPVGWLDSEGNGQIGLALRCGQYSHGTVRLSAGSGIVAGAIPEAEVREVQAKLQPMREAIRAAH